jgi:hypothetical protein
MRVRLGGLHPWEVDARLVVFRLALRLWVQLLRLGGCVHDVLVLGRDMVPHPRV